MMVPVCLGGAMMSAAQISSWFWSFWLVWGGKKLGILCSTVWMDILV